MEVVLETELLNALSGMISENELHLYRFCSGRDGNTNLRL